MAAACSDAPSASSWPADETWPEAAATWSAPSPRPAIASFSGRVIPRIAEKQIPAPEAVSLLDYGSAVPLDTFSKNSFENKAIFPTRLVAITGLLTFACSSYAGQYPSKPMPLRSDLGCLNCSYEARHPAQQAYHSPQVKACCQYRCFCPDSLSAS